jgi:hypothetical protein
MRDRIGRYNFPVIVFGNVDNSLANADKSFIASKTLDYRHFFHDVFHHTCKYIVVAIVASGKQNSIARI